MPTPTPIPLTVVEIDNPRLAEEARDFFAVTEVICLPRKFPCLTVEDNPVYGDDDTFTCQTGCDEEPFMFIVEPEDTIQIQFQLPDQVNEDPQDPDSGWYNNEEDPYFIRLEVLDSGNNNVFNGFISEIADTWYVGANEDGVTVQYVNINVNRLLEEIGTDCFYFRATVSLGVGEYLSVNRAGPALPAGPWPIGFLYFINAGPEQGYIYEWGPSGWVQIRPPFVDGEWIYIASLGSFFSYNESLGVWEVEAGTPPPDEEAFQYFYTMPYRVRKCDEPVVRFSATMRGVDCIGFLHDLPEIPLGGGAGGPFQWDFKVLGSCETIKLSAQRELTKNNRLVSVREGMSAQVRTTGMPKSVAYVIRAILASKEFYIDGERYDDGSELQRNNDIGEHWWLDFEVSRTDCDTSTTC